MLYLIISVMVLLPVASYGYIDPGTGHLLWQAMLSAFFGAGFFLKKARSIFSRSEKNTATSLPKKL